MATNLITQDRLKSLLTYDPDTGDFTRRKTGAKTGRQSRNGYMRVNIGNTAYLAHRLAWLYFYGSWPDDCIDHINQDRADNRITNLRVVTKSQNQHNRKRSLNNTSGKTGVCWFPPKQKWRAYIKRDGKPHHLGWFKSLDDAVAARVNAEKTYHPSRPDHAND